MKKVFSFEQFKKELKDLVFPEYRCVFCGRECEDSYLCVCEHCKTEVLFLEHMHTCKKCGMPINSNFQKLCKSCVEMKYSFDKAVACVGYEGAVVSCVHGFKYSNKKYLAKFLARMMQTRILEQGLKFDVICFVPMFEAKQKEREYNQAELIANELSKLFKIKVCDCLKKVKDTVSQTKFDAKERKENLKGAFAVKSKNDVAGNNILLVDDVFTTGTTLDYCSKELKDFGANSVVCATFAKVVLDN